MRIVLCYPVEQSHRDRIAHAVPEAEIVDAGQERVAQELRSADIFCGHPKVPIDWPDVVRQGRLKWIQSSAAGLDHLMVPSVIESDILITSASGVLANQVAEHALALITAWHRSLPVFFQAQKDRQFVRLPTRDVHGKTVGIIGFGGVGRRVAEVLSPFKTTILACDLFPVFHPPHVADVVGLEQLDEVLGRSDILILSAPLTDRTRGMVDAEFLARIKQGSLLVNVARGPIVVEQDLVRALRGGHLAGAVMDVTETEPLPVESELWDMLNVIITPHVAGQSAQRIDQMTDFFRDNLTRYLAGRPLKNVVDKELGFPRPVAPE